MSPFRKEVILLVGLVGSLLMGCGASKEETARHSIQKGDTFFQNRLYSDALGYYEGALEALPTDADLHLKIGLCRMNLKRPDDAIRSFEIAMRQNPKLAEAYQRKGEILINTNKLDAASDFADEVVAVEGMESIGYYLLGKVSQAKRDYAAALEHLENSLEFDPDYTPAQEALVEAYRMSDKIEPAVNLIESLLEKKPGDIPLTAQLAFLYEAQGNTERAISLLAKLINDNPENGRLRSALARLYLSDGKNDLAEQENRTALSLDPDDPVALYVSGMLAMGKGDLEQAYEDLKAAQERLPGDGMIQNAFREVQIARGKLTDPIRTLKEKIADSGETPELLIQLADAHLFLGDAGMAVAELQKVLDQDPENKSAMIVQAHALLSMGNRAAAEQYLERIGESENPRVQVMRGILANDSAMVTAAVNALKSKETTLSWGRYFSGVFKLVSGQLESGIAELDEAFEIDESFGMPMDELGRLYMSLNEPRIAQIIYGRLGARFPESTRPPMMIARMRDRMGQTESALVVLDGLIERAPDFQPARFFAATLYLKQQKFEEAKKIFQELVEETADDPVAQLVFRGVLAKTHLFAQEYASAVEQYDKILEVRPDFPVAQVEKSLAQMADGKPGDALLTAAAALENATEKTIPSIVHSILLQQNGKVVEALAGIEDVAKQVEGEAGKKEDLVPILAGMRISAGEFDAAREAIASSNRPQTMKDVFLSAIDIAEQNRIDFGPMTMGLLFGYYNWPEPAIAIHRQLLRRNPEVPLFVANLGEVLQQAGRDEEAYQVYADAVKWAPENVYFIRTKAKLASRLGRHQEAMEDLLKVAAKDPTDPALQFQLGTVYEKQKLPEDALACYGRILGMEEAGNTLLAAAANNLAWIASQDPARLDEALAHAERALELSPAHPRTGWKDANILDTLGWIHYQKGNLDEAMTHIGRAQRMLPYHPTINYHLGRIYEDKGEIETATNQYIKALETNSDFEESGDARQRLQAIALSEQAKKENESQSAAPAN